VFFNDVHQNMICAGNNPPPYNDFDWFTNTVDGRSIGQCATENSPPPPTWMRPLSPQSTPPRPPGRTKPLSAAVGLR
jgi:hypothetical protein